jgi:hypothetical protein
MGATQTDLSLGVGPEIARPALRPRLAGEARHLHRKQVPRARGAAAQLPRARGPGAASWPRPRTACALNFRPMELFQPDFILSLIFAGYENFRRTAGERHFTCPMISPVLAQFWHHNQGLLLCPQFQEVTYFMSTNEFFPGILFSSWSSYSTDEF